MEENKKVDMVRSMFSNCTFNNSVVAGIAESGSQVFYQKAKEPEEKEVPNGLRQSVIDYVNRLMPVVAVKYQEDYSKIWKDILEEDAVSNVIYDRGRQKGTVFNRNLVAQISRMMLLDGIIVKNTNDVMMAELLEPEKGKDHPVRCQLGLTPDDNKVKKAVEEVFKRHGVKVS